MSTLSAFPFIGEQSFGTPGAFNSPLSILSANIAAVNADVGAVSGVTITPPSGNTITIASNLSVTGQLQAGPIYATGPVRVDVPSGQTNYLYLSDVSNLRSDYIIGSQVGGTADGLNIWDDSGQTLIVSFSKQSVRFFQQVVGPVFDVGGALADTLNAATFGTGADSKESRIQAAISAASAVGISRVDVPASLYPYSTLSVSFDTRVQMVREGGDWSVYDVLAYGIPANDGIDRTAALQSVESARPAGSVVYFPAGTYILAESSATKLFRITQAGTYDFRGAVLKYGGSSNIGNGSDGGGVGIVNVTADGVELWGKLHCNNKAKYAVAIKGGSQRLGIFGSILSTLTTNGQWPGIHQNASADVAGALGATPSISLYGWLSRPQCPFIDTTDSITSAHDVTAAILGGDSVTGSNTGVAIVMGGAYAVCLSRLDIPGVMLSMKIQDDNEHWLDLNCHDVNCNTFELHGSKPSTVTNGYPVGTIWGEFIKSGANSGWFHYNVFSGTTILPNINITGGTSANNGLIQLRGTQQALDGTAIVPTYSFLSESSLGIYRSGASTVAISAGTFQTVSPDRSESLVMRHTGSGNWRIGKVGTNTGTLFVSTDSGHLSLGAGVGSTLRFTTNGGVDRLIVDSAGNIIAANPIFHTSGSAIAPPVAFSSESSLGWYRSAASVMALSYGGLGVKNGTNASFGTAVLGSNGSVNVPTTYVAAGDVIFLTDQTAGGTLGDIELGGIRAGSGFTILSTSITDTSTVGWLIVRPT